MPTDKPQFNVYLDPAIAKEISSYAERQGFKRGKLVETLWKVYQMRDLQRLYNKMALHVTKGVSDSDKAVLYKIYQLLKPLFVEEDKK